MCEANPEVLERGAASNLAVSMMRGLRDIMLHVPCMVALVPKSLVQAIPALIVWVISYNGSASSSRNNFLHDDSQARYRYERSDGEMEEMVQRVGHPSLLIDKNDVSELYE